MPHIIMNIRYLVNKANLWTSRVFAFLGILSLVVPLSDCFPPGTPWIRKLLIGLCIIAITWLLIASITLAIVRRINKVSVVSLNNGHHVYVQYGDIFSDQIVKNPKSRRSIVIPVNRCFDTWSDDDLISSASLHGIAMKKIYKSGKTDKNDLAAKLQRNLISQGLKSELLAYADKPKGSLLRYPVGSIAEYKHSSICTYFFFGLTVMDANLSASVSDEDYATALIKLLLFCESRSQGHPILIPLFGTGLAKTGKSEREVLEYLVRFFELHKQHIHSDIHMSVKWH